MVAKCYRLSASAIAVAVCFLMAYQVTAPAQDSALKPGLGSDSSAASLVPTPSTSSTVELDLVSHKFVSPNLIYQEYFNTGSHIFPTLLKGTAAKKFWPTGQSIMELAPKKTNSHTTGLLLFTSAASANVTVHAVGAVEPVVSGDGLEAYLYLDPAHPANWTIPFFMDGKLAPCQGTVIFPYSQSPYIVVQWDPAYSLYRCGGVATGDFNLYLVTPATNGAVRATLITTYPGIGTSHSVPSAGDYLRLKATYSLTSGVLNASLTDLNSSSVSSFLAKNLTSAGFSPGYNLSARYYFGIGGCGNPSTSWGAIYADVLRT